VKGIFRIKTESYNSSFCSSLRKNLGTLERRKSLADNK
jgi:hypothetical protein